MRSRFPFLLMLLFGLGVWQSHPAKSAEPQTLPTLVKEIAIGTASSSPSDLRAINNRFCFSAYNNQQLWCSDGTTQGTQKISDQYKPNHRNVFRGALYFRHNQDEPFVTNGTPSGTRPLPFKDATILSSRISTVNENILYGFSFAPVQRAALAGQHFYDIELWRSDGTVEGTKLVHDIGETMAPNGPTHLTSVNGVVLYYYDGLWRTQGAPNTTSSLTVGNWQGGFANQFATTNTLFFFSNGIALGRSNGQPDGTYRLTTTAQFITRLFSAGNKLYFQGLTEGLGHELWVSDGTEQGTRLVTDKIASGWESSFPVPLAQINGQLYFTAQAKGVRSLWRTDGSEVGTVKVADLPATLIQVHNGHDGVWSPAVVGNQLYFTIGRNALPSNWDKVWQSDGTADGTRPVRHANGSPLSGGSLLSLNGVLYLAASQPETGVELWKVTR